MMAFYSARLRFIIIVDNGKPKKRNHYNETVIVFKAKDFNHAFERALEIGRTSEQTYKNGNDQNVRWALVEVSNLDFVGKKIDGVEVASSFDYKVSEKPINPNQRFYPEKSTPYQSF